MDAVVIGLVSAIAGYVGGHLHARVGSSSCMYGLCSVTDLNVDVEKKENSEKPQENNNI
jgi:hypothetical protein